MPLKAIIPWPTREVMEKARSAAQTPEWDTTPSRLPLPPQIAPVAAIELSERIARTRTIEQTRREHGNDKTFDTAPFPATGWYSGWCYSAGNLVRYEATIYIARLYVPAYTDSPDIASEYWYILAESDCALATIPPQAIPYDPLAVSGIEADLARTMIEILSRN